MSTTQVKFAEKSLPIRMRTTDAIWVILLAAVAARVVATGHFYLLEVHSRCSTEVCGPPAVSPHELHLLHVMGISLDVYALAYVAMIGLFITINCAIAGAILFRRGSDRFATYTAFALTLFAGFGLGQPDQLFHRWYPALWLPVATLSMFGYLALLVFVYLFPDGRPTPRWPGVILAFFALTQIPTDLAPGWARAVERSAGPVANPAIAVISLSLFASLVYSQVHRYRRVSTTLQREQTKWVVYGIAVTIVGWAGILALYNSIPFGRNPIADFLALAAGTFIWLVIPASIGVAILRYKLWDIDILINRTLVYGSLTVSLAALYIGGVVGLQTLFRALTGQSSELAVAIATLAIAALFNPWRHRLQIFIDRRFYRHRYDAAIILARFAVRSRDESDIDRLVGDIIAVMESTVQPAHLAVWLPQG